MDIWFDSAVHASTTAQSHNDTRLVLILLSHQQIDNIGDDFLAMMAEQAYCLRRAGLATAFRKATPDILISNVRLYSKHLTPDEVVQMNAFYETCTGKKMLQTPDNADVAELAYGSRVDSEREPRCATALDRASEQRRLPQGIGTATLRLPAPVQLQHD